jgi:hypothetical protein
LQAVHAAEVAFCRGNVLRIAVSVLALPDGSMRSGYFEVAGHACFADGRLYETGIMDTCDGGDGGDRRLF